MHHFSSLIENNFSGVLQPIFIAVFIWSTITICSGLLILQSELVKRFHLLNFSFSRSFLQSLNEIFEFQKNTVMALFFVSDLFWSFGAVTVCCEICQRALDVFEGINCELFQLEWYLYPNDMGRILLQIRTNAQKLPQFRCFGSLTCERVVVKHVSVLKKYHFFVIENCSI